ncbi:MAG: hypothetical protein ACI8RD_004207 [Bacillariaceae sp.]|jgi:hypothetical protein
MSEKAKSSVRESPGVADTSSSATTMKNISPTLVHQTLLSHTDVLNQMMKTIKTPSPSFQQYQDEIRLVHEVDVNVNIKKSSIMKRIFHDNILNTIIMSNNNDNDNDNDIDSSDNNCSRIKDDLLSPLFRLLIELHEKIRALVPSRKDLHSILKDDYYNNKSESSNPMMFLISRIIEAGKALSMLESQFQSETTISWIDLANHHIQRQRLDEHKTLGVGEGLSVVGDDISFLICSLLYLMEKTDRAQKEKDAFYFEHVISPYLFKNNNNNNNDISEGYKIERNAMENKFNSCLPITRKWIQNMMMMTSNNNNNNDDDNSNLSLISSLEKCHNERRLFITKGWIESILFEEKHEIQIPEIFYLDVNAIRSIRNVTRLAVTGCALGLHAATLITKRNNNNNSNNSNNGNNNPLDILLNDKLSGERLVRALRGGDNNIQEEGEQQSYEEYIEDTMVGIAQGWAEETATSSPITEDEIATLRGQTRNVLRGQDPVIQLMNNRMKSIFLDLALNNTNDLSTTAAVPHKIQSGGQKRIDNNLTKNDDDQEDDEVPTAHPIFVQNAEKVFCSRGLAFFAKDLARATLLSVKIPQLACNLYDKMILDIIQENVYESVD